MKRTKASATYVAAESRQDRMRALWATYEASLAKSEKLHKIAKATWERATKADEETTAAFDAWKAASDEASAAWKAGTT